MIRFSSAGGSAIRCEMGSVSLIAFPEKVEKGAATLQLLSHPEESPTSGVLSWPGEYDIAGVTVRGIGHNEGAQVSFVVQMEDMRIAFISSPLIEWSAHELELLGDVHVLVLPADDPKIAQNIIDEVDPRVLMPVPGLEKKAYADVLKICGAQGQETVDEYKLKTLPVEGREVVVLAA